MRTSAIGDSQWFHVRLADSKTHHFVVGRLERANTGYRFSHGSALLRKALTGLVTWHQGFIWFSSTQRTFAVEQACKTFLSRSRFWKIWLSLHWSLTRCSFPKPFMIFLPNLTLLDALSESLWYLQMFLITLRRSSQVCSWWTPNITSSPHITLTSRHRSLQVLGACSDASKWA